MTNSVRISGRILYLTEDPELVRTQLLGQDVRPHQDQLADDVSTDEIIPGWACFWYDETLGAHTQTAFRTRNIGREQVRSGGFEVIVSGWSRGCGSSRETAPYSEWYAGIRLVIARSFAATYRQNCHNIGLYTSTDFGLIERLHRGEVLSVDELVADLDRLSALTVRSRGLMGLSRARRTGATRIDNPKTRPRPMTLTEKILASHVVDDSDPNTLGVQALAPGDSLFCRPDVRFTHDYVTPMSAEIFQRAFGANARVCEPHRVYAFRDHLTFLDRVMPEAQRAEGLLRLADGLADRQAEFCEKQGIRLYGETESGGSEAICHNAVLEDIARPGQLIVGTDSHTCTAGALGCFALGVGATDMANAWFSGDVRIAVPETVRIDLEGTPPWDVSGKDIMLAIMANPYFASGENRGQVLEFGGPVISSMGVDERATLTNMAVEVGALTAIIAGDEKSSRYIEETRGVSLDPQSFPQSDPDAEYAHRLEVEVDTLVPMVATPGDPRNGRPITGLERPIKIDIAYAGSCTGGKQSDMDLYAEVLSSALDHGMRVAPGVQFFIQFGSQRVKEYARSQGYLRVFQEIGAEVLEPSCGACIRAGPGISTERSQVTISASNRNYPGRSGPGQVYLASPRVVAASAIAGAIVRPDELWQATS
ncbi:MAG: aconitase family protein [Myxococcota bacterium]